MFHIANEYFLVTDLKTKNLLFSNIGDYTINIKNKENSIF